MMGQQFSPLMSRDPSARLICWFGFDVIWYDFLQLNIFIRINISNKNIKLT